MGWEQSFLLYVQEHMRMPGLDWLMKDISYLGTFGACFIVMGVVLLLIPKTRKYGLITLFGLLVMVIVVNVVIKPSVARIRPYEVMDNLKLLVVKEIDFSFPSGHAASGFAASTALMLALPKGKKRFAAISFALAAAISWSRLYVGVHFPTDVIAGIVIGTLCGVLGYFIEKWLEKLVAKKRKVS